MQRTSGTEGGGVFDFTLAWHMSGHGIGVVWEATCMIRKRSPLISGRKSNKTGAEQKQKAESKKQEAKELT